MHVMRFQSPKDEGEQDRVADGQLAIKAIGDEVKQVNNVPLMHEGELIKSLHVITVDAGTPKSLTRLHKLKERWSYGSTRPSEMIRVRVRDSNERNVSDGGRQYDERIVGAASRRVATAEPSNRGA